MTTKRKTRFQSASRIGICALVVVTVMAGGAIAATTTADSWTAASSHGEVEILLNGGSATVAFGYSSPPLAADVKLWADATAEGASFAGDYRRAGVTALDFNLSSSTQPALSRVMLAGVSGRRWIKTGQVSGANSVSFDQAGWVLAAGSDDSAEAWETDLRDVAGLGLHVIRDQRNVNPHDLSVAAFQLAGSQTVGAAQPTLEDALFAAFGVRSLADVDGDSAAADDDGDGMSNLNEVLALFQDGYFADNLFKADLSVSAGEMTIHFACVPGTYAVLRADSVDGDYDEIGTVVTAETGTDQFVDTNPGEGPNFYRVVQQ